MMIAITAGFLFLSAVHSSHVVKLQYSRNGASTFSSVSVTTVAGQLLRDLSSESLSPILKRRTQSLTDLTSMALSPYTPQTCMNPYGTGAFQSKKFSYLSLPSTYVHNTRHLSPQLCWTQVTGWSIDDPAGIGQCPYRWVWKEILPGSTFEKRRY